MSASLYLLTIKGFFIRSATCYRLCLALGVLFSAAVTGKAQTTNQLNETTKQQLAVLFQEKATRTPAQQKMNSQLIFAASNVAPVSSVSVFRDCRRTLSSEKDGRVKVDIKADVSDDLLAAIKAAGGEVFGSFPVDHAINAFLPIENVESIAARNDVKFIRPTVGSVTNTGSVDSEGDVAHRSNLARPYGAAGSESKSPCFPIASMMDTALWLRRRRKGMCQLILLCSQARPGLVKPKVSPCWKLSTISPPPRSFTLLQVVDKRLKPRWQQRPRAGERRMPRHHR